MEENEQKEKGELKVFWEKEEKDKRLALWAGIIFFMVLIMLLWFFTTRNFLANLKNDKKPAPAKIEDVTTEFKQSFSELNSHLQELKNSGVVEENVSALISSTTAQEKK